MVRLRQRARLWELHTVAEVSRRVFLNKKWIPVINLLSFVCVWWWVLSAVYYTNRLQSFGFFVNADKEKIRVSA